MRALSLTPLVLTTLEIAQSVSAAATNRPLHGLTTKKSLLDDIEGSKALQACLASKDVPVSFQTSTGFSQLAEPYNLRLVYTPLAIVQPTTSQQVAGAVLCAGQSNVSVQAKSGGRKLLSSM